MIYSNWLREKSHNAIKFGEAAGNPCVLKYSKGKKLKNYEIYGNSVQETRSGKNILPYPYAETTKTENGLTFTNNENGTITVKGTASADTTFNLCTDLVLTAGTYTFSGCPSNGSNTTYFISGFTGTDIGSGFTVVLDSDTTGSLSITIKSGTTISNKVFKPQIEVGSEKTSYEQYGAMPSPDYPSEIQSVGDLVTDTASEYYGKYDVPVTVTGKNLLSSIYSVYSSKCTVINNEKNSYIAQGNEGVSEFAYSAGDVKMYTTNNCRINETITISLYVTLLEQGIYSNKIQILGGPLNNHAKYYIRRNLNLNERTLISMTITPTANIDIICIRLNNNKLKIEMDTLQIEYGTTATEYEPYTSSTQHIYLDEPLRKVGEYSDYIDFRNNKVVRNIVKMNLSDLLWKTNSTSSLTGQFWANSNFDIIYAEGTSGVSFFLCTTYRVARYSEYKTADNIIYSSNNTKLIYIKDTDYTDLETFKSEVKGVLIASLATPIEETIDNLPDIITNNREVCIIRTDTQVQPSNIKVKYIRL